jgi:hypothetical protein
MDKVRELRRHAEECLKHAANATSADTKGHYEELARVWRKLADERMDFFVPEQGD